MMHRAALGSVVLMIIGLNCHGVSALETLATCIKVVKANPDQFRSMEGTDAQWWIQTVEIDLEKHMRNRLVGFSRVKVRKTSPIIEIDVTTSDKTYASVVQKELETIMEEVLDNAKMNYHGVEIVSFSVMQTGLMGFTKSVAMIEASLKPYYEVDEEQQATLRNLKVQISILRIQPDLEDILKKHVTGYIAMDFIQLAPSLELVILVDPVVDPGRTRAAVEHALHETIEEDKKVGPLRIVPNSVRVPNHNGRRIPLQTRVSFTFVGDTFKSKDSKTTIKYLLQPSIEQDVKALKDIDIRENDPTVKLVVVTYSDEERNSIRDSVRRGLTRALKHMDAIVDSSLEVKRPVRPPVWCKSRARFTLKEVHGDLRDEYNDMSHELTQIMVKAVTPELRGFLLSVMDFKRFEVKQVIPTFEMDIYTETSPDEIDEIKPSIEGALEPHVNAGHLGNEWHPEDGSLVVESPTMMLQRFETEVKFKFFDNLEPEYSNVDSVKSRKLIDAITPELAYDIADEVQYYESLEVKQIDPKCVVHVVTSSPMYVQRTEIQNGIERAVKRLLDRRHLGHWHPSPDTLEVAGKDVAKVKTLAVEEEKKEAANDGKVVEKKSPTNAVTPTEAVTGSVVAQGAPAKQTDGAENLRGSAGLIVGLIIGILVVG